jgi:DHA3 family macrolide efflux protein-like MFS transporter
VLLTALLGLFAAGPFAVWVPLRASSESASPARAIGLLMALFPLGTIVGSLALRFMPASLPRRPALLAAHAAGSLCIAGAGLAPTLGLGAALLALWGACGAVFISCGRAFLLEASPPEEHGRRLADLQLALLLASPLGALLAGVSAGWVGARASMVLLGAAALLGAGTLALAGGARGREPLRLLGVRDAP